MKLKTIVIALALQALWVTTFSQSMPLTPSDGRASAQTVNLYQNLHRLLGKGVMFGHQDDLAYGVGWRNQKDRSDVKDVTGQYPAVYGWELGNLELDSARNLDNVPFSDMRNFIREGYERGSVITISWHANNPLTGKSAWDPAAGTVASILPGGNKHELFNAWLGKVGDFLGSLRGSKGEAIPILFRPWHELTGNWFWWCQNVCTPDEFRRLWIYTASYLRDTKKLHNLLMVYNTAEFSSIPHFMERYPGDKWVDIISFDSYQQGSTTADEFTKQLSAGMDMLTEIYRKSGKIPALGETGYEAIPQADWWTRCLLPALASHKVSYVLLWRNACKMPGKEKLHYYAPYPGQMSAADFKIFSNDASILFSERAQQENLYGRYKKKGLGR